MDDTDHSEQQLAQELAELRQRIEQWQTSELEPRATDVGLRVGDEQLRTVFDRAAIGIALIDNDERFVEFNETLCAMLGYTREELQQLGIRDVTAPGERVISPKDDHRGEKYHRLEKRYTRKDGSRFWGDLYVTVIEDVDGNPQGMLGIVIDISERKRTDAALQQHNRNLALLNQVSQALIATLDLPQILEQLLRAAIGITSAGGSSVWLWDEDRPGELVCRAILLNDQFLSPRGLRLRPGEGVAGWVAQRGQSALVGNAQDDVRFSPTIDRTVAFHTTSLLAVPLKMRDQISGVLEVVNKHSATALGPADFSADDCLLVEMLAASATIAIYNARLVEALRQYGMELEARNQELDAFAHSVAHDLKNPLGHVVGFAELLEQNHSMLSHEERQQCLTTIAQTGRKMSNIIDELLLLAGVRKKERVEMSPVDTASVIAEAQGRLADLISEHRATIMVPAAWPVALGYGPWVEEVWVNYVSNAILYGGRPPCVELGATVQEDGAVRFWVRDNGDGLTPEEQSRLFTSFERLDRVRAKGHGLGLSIVRRIVEKLGGQVGVESQLGVGSVFSFTLPGPHSSD